MNTGRFTKGFTPWNKGMKMKINGYPHFGFHGRHSEETRKKIGDKGRGRRAWNKGIPLSEATKRKLRLSLAGRVAWNKGKKYLQVTGAKNPNWRGGVTPENEKIRKSLEYKKWRADVLKKDNYTCILCGVVQTRKCPLVVDHIKPFSLFPELRFEVSNGRSLCRQCDLKNGFRWNRHISLEQNKALVGE